METIIFTCEVITPMFLAGADGSTPEIRPASIKGALRFWWRAMNGHLPLEDLKKREAEIFGGAGEGMGRSNVIIRVLPPFPKKSDNNQLLYHRLSTYDNRYGISILDYLAFGISTYRKDPTANNKNYLTRSYLDVGQTFQFQFIYKREFKSELAKSLFLLEKYGGLGAKSRNGFGSFNILTNREFLESIDLDFFSKQEMSSFTSLSKSSKILYLEEFRSWQKALAKLGEQYQKARQNIESWHNYDRRQLIAAPIIVKCKGVSENKAFMDRHAKPYFLHVSKISNNMYAASILVIPSNFLEFNDEHRRENYRAKYDETIEYFNEELLK